MKFAIFFLLGVASVSQSAVLRKYEPRIINGEDVAPGEIPYQISLQRVNTSFHFCGGSILNEYYVITAAHCVIGKAAEDIMVVVGTVNLDSPLAKHRIESIFYHENYKPSNSYANDIALIKVKTPFVRSHDIGFINLPEQDEVVNAGDVATVSGFGRLSQEGKGSRILQRASIFIAKQEYCREMYRLIENNIHDTQICANDPSISRGSCKGDSGGPLTVNGKLVGLVSWAKACSLTDFPTVYTRVPSYINWINEHAI